MSHKISTLSLKEEDFVTKKHELDPKAIRTTVSLGDMAGLTKMGVHIVRLPPHSRSSELHWHTRDDEWVYILDAGESSATLRTLLPGDKEPREEPLRTGDFVAWPANTRVGHVVCSGGSEVTFLCAGTREPTDVCTYPLVEKKLVVDRQAQEAWYTDESSIVYHKK